MTFNCVCFTWNNPDGLLEFDPDTMQYLVYQEEVGATGNYHLQGYCEFLKRTRQNRAKQLLGGRTVHIERREGTQDEAIQYCKQQYNVDGDASSGDKRLFGTEVFEAGTPKQQGKRNDLEAFKDAVNQGARQKDLVDDHFGTIARYPRFYGTLTSMIRPKRQQEPMVTLLYGGTGLGKTRYVIDKHGDSDDFWQSSVNNGTIWYDSYDRHRIVLIDDFAGRASHCTLNHMLLVLDRYPQRVPTKGGHTWWMPDEVYVTTNILPRDWWTWENRGAQYRALARRFTHVRLYYVPLPGTDHCLLELLSTTESVQAWFQDNAPPEAEY